MPKPDYRIPSRREREMFNQVRNLQERLGALSEDPSAELEINYLKDAVAERDSAIAGLESELESERARAARLRGELESSRARRKDSSSIILFSDLSASAFSSGSICGRNCLASVVKMSSISATSFS